LSSKKKDSKIPFFKRKSSVDQSGNQNDLPGGNPYSAYARYWGMAVQMIFIIAGGSFGGYLLDKWLNLPFPIFTLVLSLGSVALAIWLFIREFNNQEKQ
jgi:hypothetical protein